MDSSLHDLFLVDGTVARLAEAITSVGVIGVFVPASLVFAVFVWRRSQSLALATVTPAATWVTAVITALVKDLTDRERPVAAAAYDIASAAFPSGHASNTTAFVVSAALVVAVVRPEWRTRALVVAVVAAIVMGWTRLALGVHWATDVLAGWALGVAIAVAVFRISQTVTQK